MRKIIIALLLMSTTLSYSQFEMGLKTGLSSTELAHSTIFADNNGQNIQLSVADAKYGFHFGLYTRVSFLGIYVEPAFLFNSSNVDYNLDQGIFDTGIISTVRSETYNNLDIPLMIGCKLGFFRVQAGPVAHIFLNSASELTSVSGYSQKFKEATYGMQAGIGLDILKVRLDLNYEANLSKFGEHINIGGSDYDFDERPGRLVASLGIKF